MKRIFGNFEWVQRFFGTRATEQKSPSGWTGSGKRQGVSQGTMRGPRLSTWRFFLFCTQNFTTILYKKRGSSA